MSRAKMVAVFKEDGVTWRKVLGPQWWEECRHDCPLTRNQESGTRNARAPEHISPDPFAPDDPAFPVSSSLILKARGKHLVSAPNPNQHQGMKTEAVS